MRGLFTIKFGLTSLLIGLAVAFFAAGLVFAQETPEQAAQRHGITFPIASLGNCASVAECRTFCEDPLNQAVCTAFAKEQGIHKEGPTGDEAERVLAAARTQLGCTSSDSCLSLCQDPANYDRCASFARSQGLAGGHVADPAEAQFLAQARQTLGCSTAAECSSFCDQPGNRDRCSQFAQQVGLRGGQHSVGPGGCTSEDTCRDFCSDPTNYQVCSGFAQAQGQGFAGPGGCNSEQSCRTYCESNLDKCKVVSVGGSGLIDNPAQAAEEYKKFCQANPQGCAAGASGIFSSNQTRAEFERFCSANPEKCGADSHVSGSRKAEYEKLCKDNPSACATGPGGYQIPKDLHGEGGYVDPGDYCKKYPDRCGGTGGTGGYNPAEMCSRTPNCSWVGNTCQCSSSGGTGGTGGTGTGPTPPPGYPTPGGGYQTPSGSYPTPGGSSGGTYTQPSGGTYSPPSGSTYTPPPTDSGSSDTGSYTPPPSDSGSSSPPPSDSGGSSSPPPPSPTVYGTGTGRGVLRILWDSLLRSISQ